MSAAAPTQSFVRRYSQHAIGGIVLGIVGTGFGLAGFLAVLAGDDMIDMNASALAMAILAVVAFGGVFLVRDYPGYAAIAMALAPIGYVIACAGSWGLWWTRYQDAVATGAAAESAFWSSMPAMALFTISGLLLVAAVFLVAYDALRREDADVTEAFT